MVTYLLAAAVISAFSGVTSPMPGVARSGSLGLTAPMSFSELPAHLRPLSLPCVVFLLYRILILLLPSHFLWGSLLPMPFLVPNTGSHLTPPPSTLRASSRTSSAM